MGKLFTCGCSYTYGHGLTEDEKSVSDLVADSLGLEQLNMSRSGASNYGVYLQALHALENATEGDLVIVSMTSTYRTEWMASVDDMYEKLNVYNIDYSFQSSGGDEHVFSDNERYKGNMKMSQYWHPSVDEMRHNMRNSEDMIRGEVISKFFVLCYPRQAKIDYDESLFVTLQHMFIQKNIPHIFILPESFSKIDYISSDNLVEWDWFTKSSLYPDKKGWGHVDGQGHEVVFDLLKESNIYKQIGGI